MENKDKLLKPETEDEPQVFKPEKKEGRWTFSRRDFMKLAVATAAGAVAALLPRAKDILGRRVQLVAHATALTQPGIQPGQTLTKIWYLKNNASQPWGEGVVLHLGGAAEWQTVSSISLPNLSPGQVTPVRVSMVVPVGLDPQPVMATIEIPDEIFNFYLPIIHKSSVVAPCTCDSHTPCSCDSVVPCTCDYYICPCDYDVPCTCDTFYCPCDYEVPCTCDYYYCPCDYEVPCTCDYDVCSCVGYTCPCVSYTPCGCVGHIPCGCDFYFPSQG